MHYEVTCGDERGCLGIFSSLRKARAYAEPQRAEVNGWIDERMVETWRYQSGEWFVVWRAPNPKETR